MLVEEGLKAEAHIVGSILQWVNLSEGRVFSGESEGGDVEAVPGRSKSWLCSAFFPWVGERVGCWCGVVSRMEGIFETGELEFKILNRNFQERNIGWIFI